MPRRSRVTLLRTFADRRAPVSALVFSADGKQLLAGAHDGTAILWDMTTLPK